MQQRELNWVKECTTQSLANLRKQRHADFKTHIKTHLVVYMETWNNPASL